MKTLNEIIDGMNLDDEVKRISKESLEYYRNHIDECDIDILRLLYAELEQENERLRNENDALNDFVNFMREM